MARGKNKKEDDTDMSQADDVLIVAFVEENWSEGGEGDEGVGTAAYLKGQRLELTEADFTDLENAGRVVRGVYIEMITGVEGGKYSLKPNAKTYVPPYIYEGWKDAGICRVCDTDPTVFEALEGRAVAQREALESLAASQEKCVQLESQIAEMFGDYQEHIVQVKSRLAGATLALSGDKPDIEAALVELEALSASLPKPDGEGDAQQSKTA